MAVGRPKRQALVCIVEGCGSETKARDMCNKHYRRLLRYGEPRPGWIAPQAPVAPISEKRCNRCNEIKQISEFSVLSKRSKPNRFGQLKLMHICKPCNVVKNREYNARKPEIRRTRTWREKYGLTPDDYQAMLESQGGSCAICGVPPVNGKVLAVDHCHESETVRGLLCGPCNTGLGHFGDDVQKLEQAILYLNACRRKGRTAWA